MHKLDYQNTHTGIYWLELTNFWMDVFTVWRGCWSLHPADVVSVVSGASPFLFIFHLLFFQKGPPQPQRRCDPGKGIIWLPVVPSLSPTRLAGSSFLSVFLSLTWYLLEILPLSPGMDVPPETSKHVKKSTSQKLEDQKKVRHLVHSYHFRCLALGWKFKTISSEMRFSTLVFLLCSKLLLFLYVLLIIYKHSSSCSSAGV